MGLPIKENTRKGYRMAYPGDSVNLAYATTNTRRGRVGWGLAHTLTADGKQGTLEAKGRIRRLTPRECLRLQGWEDPRIDKVLPIQSDSQLYKQAGREPMLELIRKLPTDVSMERLKQAWYGGRDESQNHYSWTRYYIIKPRRFDGNWRKNLEQRVH